jgi:hypothetical protein
VVAKEGDGHDDVVDLASAGNEARHPAEDGGSAAADLEEGQASEAEDNTKGIDRGTTLCSASQNPRRATFESQAVGALGRRKSSMCYRLTKSR